MFLTYTSIVGSYSPTILKGLSQGFKKSAVAKAAPAHDAPSTAEPAANVGAPEKVDAPEPAASAPRPSAVGLVIGVAAIVAIIYITPFLLLMNGAGFITAIIIGIGVWQAWKLNRKTELHISGPFSLSTRPAPVPPAA
jgi:hypothetical protein